MNGMTVKRIITKARLVITVLNTWSLLIREPQVPNCNRIIILKDEIKRLSQSYADGETSQHAQLISWKRSKHAEKENYLRTCVPDAL